MSQQVVEFDPKNMPFRRLGSSGLRIPVFSLGGWLTIGGTVSSDSAKAIIKTAFDNGINMIDVAEGYNAGESERETGKAIKELNLRRSDLIISTKIYWGVKNGPNANGLSRKHIIEGTKGCLERLQVDYIDILFAHRPDPSVPMEEVVRAFDWVINQGWVMYWGTSEWTSHQIEAAHHVADKLGLIAPVADQCQHNMFVRERAEREYAPLYKQYKYGTVVFSALLRGVLTGKYNDGIPEDSRYAVLPGAAKNWIAQLRSADGQEQIRKVRELTKFAETELGCSVTHLALAWVVKRNPHTSTVILGASKPEQVTENLKALDVLPKLTPRILEKIDNILDNKPTQIVPIDRDPIENDF